jgi:hypothetical protein
MGLGQISCTCWTWNAFQIKYELTQPEIIRLKDYDTKHQYYPQKKIITNGQIQQGENLMVVYVFKKIVNDNWHQPTQQKKWYQKMF